jgi:hypothetical protein
MTREMNRLDIEAHVARARRMRSEATGELIFAAGRLLRRRVAALAARLGRLFHGSPAAQH